jgi:hypothetical protein
MEAAVRGFSFVCFFLVSMGAEVSLKNKAGGDSIWYAETSEHYETAGLLKSFQKSELQFSLLAGMAKLFRKILPIRVPRIPKLSVPKPVMEIVFTFVSLFVYALLNILKL